MRRVLGLTRSLLMYYGDPLRAARMRRSYAEFVPQGGLCFDIGAHVGDRVRAWRALGARVVAVEPQPDFVRVLRRLYRHDQGVDIVDAAIGEEDGDATLLVSERTPTVTTLSQEWIDDVRRDPSFRAVEWSPGDSVPVTTLEALIRTYGSPDFVKIDVEGYEARVLRGLATPLPCLSFEYLHAARPVALECIDRLAELGDYEYNWSVGETHRLERAQWCDPAEIRRIVEGLPEGPGSGDIYVRLARGA
jgi:FkbM family methyltransferase